MKKGDKTAKPPSVRRSNVASDKLKLLEERLRWTKESQKLAIEILDLLNRGNGGQEVIGRILEKVLEFIKIEAIGLRIRQGDEYPYCATRGFSTDFVQSENSICSRDSDGEIIRDASGDPVIGCMCGRVLTGKADPTLPCFTPGGSFWTGSLGKLLETWVGRSLQDLSNTKCCVEGYTSVALIPLKSGEDVIGLLQLCDRSEDCFSPDIIAFLEGITSGVGIVLKRLWVQDQLIRSQEELELRVEERTGQLLEANERLSEQIEERGRIERELQVSESKLRTLVENADDLIWTTNTDFGYTYVSPSITSVLGYTAEEMMSKNLLDTLAPESREKMKHAFEQELNGERDGLHTVHPSQTLETEQYRKVGSTVWMEVTLTALRGALGQVSEIMGISRDITGRKHSDQVKTEFLSAAAHELRSPLTSIQGYSELLLVREDLPADDRKDCLLHINRQAKNLARLVDYLLDVTSMETEAGFPLHRTACRIDNIIRETVEEIRSEAPTHPIEISVPEKPVMLMADERRLRAVLANLLGNAVKFSPERGLIHVACEAVDDAWEVSVEDSGIGMEPEQVDKVFDKFYRGDTSDTGLPGAGIGMTLVKYVVEAHGGRLWVESQPNRGTTVRFTLPFTLNDSAPGSRPQ
jgi:PAS domain S-box-containing protein